MPKTHFKNKVAKNIEKIKETEKDFIHGYLSAPMGYKFRTRDFLNIIFLYKNSVDPANPDLIGETNKNTFTSEAVESINKIKEQVRLDIKDMNFLIPSAQSLGKFIVRSANRKALEENDFAIHIDRVIDNAVDFGSGFLKAWYGKDKKLRLKSVDPYKISFNQYNFAEGNKVETISRRYKDVITDEKYDKDVRKLLELNLQEDEHDKFVDLKQSVSPAGDGKTLFEIILSNDKGDYYLFGEELKNEDAIQYFKFDYERRDGFPDALGKGAYEKVFNLIVQDKLNRKRMDRVTEMMTKMIFMQEVDPNRDDYVGKEMIKAEDTIVIGYKNGNPIRPMDIGGSKQYNVIVGQLNQLTGQISRRLNVGDALQGNTLPSGTSGALGTLLTENQSSVHKEVQKDYAKFLSIVYKKVITPYILQVFDKNQNIEKYLSKNDIMMVKKQVINYLVALKEIDAIILNEPFDIVQATDEVKKEIDGKPLISGALLDELRDNVQNIETFISGERASKASTVAFYREMRQLYASNPALFKSSFFIELLKSEAQYESGITGVEIDNLLNSLEDDPIAQQQIPAQTV